MKNIISLFLLFTAMACSSAAQNQTTRLEVLNKKEFQMKLGEVDHSQFIDVRTSQEHAMGAIENSTNADLLNGDFEKLIPQLDKSKPVFVYCAMGGRSHKAALILKDNGFTEVYDLKGGYNSWSSNSK